MLICIGFQIVRYSDKIAIFAKFAKVVGLPKGPSCLFISIGLQVVVFFFLQNCQFSHIRQICLLTNAPVLPAHSLCFQVSSNFRNISTIPIFAEFAAYQGALFACSFAWLPSGRRFSQLVHHRHVCHILRLTKGALLLAHLHWLPS